MRNAEAEVVDTVSRVFSDKADIRTAQFVIGNLARFARATPLARTGGGDHDSRKRDDPTAIERFRFAPMRRMTLQGLMQAVLVMIGHVRSKHSSEMLFTQHYRAVETLGSGLNRTIFRSNDFARDCAAL